MLIAGGAKDGKYGQAMQIYSDIQKASAKAGEGTLQRLARNGGVCGRRAFFGRLLLRSFDIPV